MTTIDHDLIPAAPGGRPAGEPLPPLLADWMRDRRQFAATTGRAVHRGAHRAVWHTLRLPLYAARLTLMAPRGAWRVAQVVWRVMSDGEGHQLRVEAATGSDPATWLRLRKERNERIHRRLIVAGTLLALVALLGLVVVGLDHFGVISLPPAWVGWVSLFALLQVLGYVGRPLGKPLVKPATTLAGNPGPLRAPFVMEALVSLGIKGMTDPDRIGLLFDVARVGPGYQVDLELPRGVAASSVMEKRSQLSAALRRELGTVWPAVGKRHEGHLVLYVADEPMNAATQAPWALMKDGGVDLFKPVEIATDQRGRWVAVTLAYANMIIGATPRQGKTYLLRELLLIAGLDARSRVYAIDGKGTGDLAPAALFAHFYAVGDDEDEVERVLLALRKLREEMRRRAKVIRNLSHEEAPDSKVTSALADRRDLHLEPIVLGIDETQVFFADQPKAIREEIVSIVTDLVRRGPALGIIVILATQNVTQHTIPTPISNNAVLRFALRVFGWQANDQILGTGAYKAGLDATMFSAEDRGIGYLRGDDTEAQIVRSVHGLDAVKAEKVAMRARSLRSKAGRLTGAAAGEVMQAEAEQATLLEDVRHAFQAATAMHLGDLREGLEMLRPGIYGHLDNAGLAALLRDAGVRVETVYVSGKSRAESSAKGVKREWLEVSTTERIGPGEDGDERPETLTVVR